MTRLVQSSLGGRRRKRIILRDRLSRVWRRRARETAQVTTASPAPGYRRLGGPHAGPKNTNSHPGRVMTRGTDPTGAPRGPGKSTARENGSFSERLKSREAQTLHLCARRDDPAPRRIRFVPAGRLTAAVTSPPPDAAPCTTRGLLTTPPALPHPGCSRSPLTAPAEAAEAEAGLGGVRPPGCRWLWPRPLPAPRRLAHPFLRLLLLLLPQPPLPPEASLPLQQAHLFRIAPRQRAEDPPLAREGAGRQEGDHAHSAPTGQAGHQRAARASVSSDLRLLRPPPGRAAIPPPGVQGEGRSGLLGPFAWALQSVSAGEGLRRKAWGAAYCCSPSWASGPPPAAPTGLTGEEGGLGMVGSPSQLGGA